MIPVIAAMAAAGLLKGLSDKKKEEADRKQAAEMARWTPWTKMGPNEIKKADVLGSTMQGGMAGAMMGQGGMGGMMGGAKAAAPAAAGMPAQQQASMSMMGDPMQQKYPWLGMNTGE